MRRRPRRCSRRASAPACAAWCRSPRSAPIAARAPPTPRPSSRPTSACARAASSGPCCVPRSCYAPGAFGGTALFRALAAFPFVVPLPGDAGTSASSRSTSTTCAAWWRWRWRPIALVGKTLDPVGPEVVTLRDDPRATCAAGSGSARSRFVEVPTPLIGLVARCGDVLGGPHEHHGAAAARSTATSPMPPPTSATRASRAQGWRASLAAHTRAMAGPLARASLLRAPAAARRDRRDVGRLRRGGLARPRAVGGHPRRAHRPGAGTVTHAARKPPACSTSPSRCWCSRAGAPARWPHSRSR